MFFFYMPTLCFILGGATKVWLEQGLEALAKSLEAKYHAKLILRSTDNCQREINSIIQETGARYVCLFVCVCLCG